MESLSYLKAAAKHTCRKFSTREWGSEWGWGSSNNELLKDDKDCVVCQKNAKEIMDLFKTPIERTIDGRKSKSRVDSDFYEFDYSKNVNVFIGYSAYNTLCWRMQMDSREENDFHECMVCLNKEVYWENLVIAPCHHILCCLNCYATRYNYEKKDKQPCYYAPKFQKCLTCDRKI